MKKCFEVFTKVNNALKNLEMITGSLCLALLFVVMIVNASLRYLFRSGLDFSDELNGFLFVWFGFLASAYIMAQEGHLNVGAFVNLFPKKVQFAIKTILHLFLLVMIGVYIEPLEKLLNTLPISNVMRWPLKYVYVILPLCFVLMGIHIAYNIINDCINMKTLSSSERKEKA